MRPTYRLDVVGDLIFRASEGPITAATVTLRKPDATEYRADVAADGPEVDTTLAVAVAKGARRVELTSAASVVVGQELYLGNSASKRDHVIVEDVVVVGADTFIDFSRILEFDHEALEPVTSGEARVLLLADEVDEHLVNCVALWEYTVDGVDLVQYQLWDVLPNVFKLQLTLLRLQRYCAPELIRQSSQTFSELLDQATWLVSQQLRWFGIDPHWVMDVAEFERIAGLTIREILLDEEVQYAMQRERVLERAQRACVAEWDMLMKSRVRWLDKNFDGAVDETEVGHLTERFSTFSPDFTT